MFFELSQTDFASYADENTPYVEANNIDKVITILENYSTQLLKPSDHQMKANKDNVILLSVITRRFLQRQIAKN